MELGALDGESLETKKTWQGLAWGGLLAAWGIQAQGSIGLESWEGTAGGDTEASWEGPTVGPAMSSPGPRAAQPHPPPRFRPCLPPRWQRQQGQGQLDLRAWW